MEAQKYHVNMKRVLRAFLVHIV